jgi:hypothetical protein
MATLSRDEFKTLHALMTSAYQSAAELRLLVTQSGENLDNLVPPTATLANAIPAVIKAAEGDGWLADLIDTMKQQKPMRADIQGFTLALPPPRTPAATVNPYVDRVIRRNKMMVDRGPLRTAVRDMEQDPVLRFLVVTGEEKTGKTWSRHFVTHIWERRGTFDLGWLDLADMYYRSSSLQPLTPEPVAMKLFSHLRLDQALVPGKDDEKYERWSQRVCNELIRLLPGALPRQQWLMFDGFNAVPLHDGTIAFIEQFATLVESARTDLRVILIGWKGTLPPDAEDLAVRDVCRAMTEDDVKDFFEPVHRQRLPGVTDEALARAVAESVANVKQAAARGAAYPNKALGDAVASEWARLMAP